MNEQQISREAQAIYNQIHWTDEYIAQQVAWTGDTVERLRARKPQFFASVDEFAAHIRACYASAEKYGIALAWQKFDLGTTPEQFEEAAAAKLKAKKRSAGARALVAKYGKVGAESIIARKTGKHISLKS